MEQVKRIRRDEAMWREIFARHAASGLLTSQFCRQEGINPGIFRRWRVKLESSLPGSQAKRTEQPRGVKAAQSFVDLGALEAGSSRCEIRLELGGGVVLSLVRG
jgi:transposase-like protein